MNIRFTQIPNSLPYPPAVKAKLSSLHSSVVTSVMETYTGSYKQRRKIIQLINTISHMVIHHDAFPASWNESSPFEGLELIDDFQLQTLKDMYVNEKYISWDITPVETPAIDAPETSDSNPEEKERPTPQSLKEQEKKERFEKKQQEKMTASQSVPATASSIISPTPKEDLYIRPPQVPQFDPKSVYASVVAEGTTFVVYNSLPEIPTRQTEISCTTDVNKMTPAALRSLFPNRIIHTRASCFYEPVDGLEFHPDLGVLIPVEGFSRQDIIRNLVEYPHLFQLKKCVDDDVVSFYKTLEVDGELKDIFEVWNTLPDTSKLPRNADFMKEYVVRRYLLERDVKKMNHRYTLYGTLDPFLTLFMPADSYLQYGYENVEEIARKCVQARVSYKQSRNPVLRRLKEYA